MVSFGFYGKAVKIELSDFEVLRHLGFQENKAIGINYHNDYYVLPVQNNTPNRSNELKIVNVCRFLDAEVYETGVNSVFNINLKIDVLLRKGDDVWGFQAKSSAKNCTNYLTKYENKKLDPFYCVKGKKYKVDLTSNEFEAPGVSYLNIKGESHVSQYLSNLSKWLKIPVKREYVDLITLLRRRPGDLYSIDTLRRILNTDSREIVHLVAQAKTIFPIQWKNQYVSINRQRQKTKA